MWLLEWFLIFKSENNGNLFAVPMTPKKTELNIANIRSQILKIYKVENDVNLFAVLISPKKIQSGPKKAVAKDLKKRG